MTQPKPSGTPSVDLQVSRSGQVLMGVLLGLAIAVGGGALVYNTYQIQKLGTALANVRPDTSELKALREDVDSIKFELGTIGDNLAKTANEIEKLKSRADELEFQMESVATHDGREYMPNLLGNMERDPRYRDHVADAVQGKVVIANRTYQTAWMMVNGIRTEIPARRRAQVLVPLGTVTTQLCRQRYGRWITWDDHTWKRSAWDVNPMAEKEESEPRYRLTLIVGPEV